VADGVLDQVRPAAQVQLFSYLQAVPVDHLETDVEQIGDFPAGMPLGKQSEDVIFLGGQRW